MDDEKKLIDRKLLYSEVWSQPITKLAPTYGISDVGLKKICRALNVPTPPRGYWARVQNNIRVEKTPLPRLKSGQPSTYTIQKPDFMNQKPDNIIEKLSDEAVEIISALKVQKPIVVSKQLNSPHPLIQETKNALAKAETNQYGILQKWGKRYLDIRVSPKLLNRSLRIMDSIVKFCEKEEIEVSVGKDARDTHIKIFGEKVSILIREPSNRHDHIPTDKEKAKEKRYGYASYDKYDYIPSGKLHLEIDEYTDEGIRKRWADGKRNLVEQYLIDFIINAIIVADLDRTRRIEREEEEKRWEIERQRRAELERLRQIEEQRRRTFEKEADNWTKSKQLREYIKAVEAEVSKRNIPDDSRIRYEKWLTWAMAHADRLDPLTDRLTFDFNDDGQVIKDN